MRRLIRRHGITRVWAEGLTPNDMPAFRELVKQVQAIEGQVVSRLKEQSQEVQKVLTQLEAAGKEGSEGHQKALGIQKQVLGLLDEQRERRLTS